MLVRLLDVVVLDGVSVLVRLLDVVVLEGTSVLVRLLDVVVLDMVIYGAVVVIIGGSQGGGEYGMLKLLGSYA